MEEDIRRLQRRIKELEEANAQYAALEASQRGERNQLGSSCTDNMGGLRVRKDLSLMSLVTSWAGDESSVSVHQFLRGIELVGVSGNWEDRDLALATRTRIKGPAAAFLASRPDLQELEVGYAALKKALIERFRDRTSPQQYLLMLNTITQGKSEQVRAFADRCQTAGQRALCEEGEEAERRGARQQIDRVILTAFMNGLRGEVGKMIRLNPPTTMEQAIERATVMELELSNREPPDVFRVEVEERLIEQKGYTPYRDCGINDDKVIGAVRRREVLCFQCREPGHLARQCRNKPMQRESRKPEGRCFGCGVPGHWVRDCPKVRNDQPSPNGIGLRKAPFLGRQ